MDWPGWIAIADLFWRVTFGVLLIYWMNEIIKLKLRVKELEEDQKDIIRAADREFSSVRRALREKMNLPGIGEP